MSFTVFPQKFASCPIVSHKFTSGILKSSFFKIHFNPYPANRGEYGELLIMPASDIGFSSAFKGLIFIPIHDRFLAIVQLDAQILFNVFVYL